jgi:hypothetical protein
MEVTFIGPPRVVPQIHEREDAHDRDDVLNGGDGLQSREEHDEIEGKPLPDRDARHGPQGNAGVPEPMLKIADHAENWRVIPSWARKSPQRTAR